MTEEATETQATETAPSEQEAQKPKPTDTVEFWKQKAREQETRAKANASAAEKLQQFEESQKTEAQKLADQTKAAEERASAAEQRALRLEIAAEKGLTPAQAKRLVGETRDELEADATELLDTFKPATEQENDDVASSLDLGIRGSSTSSQSNPAPGADFAKFLKNMPSG